MGINWCALAGWAVPACHSSPCHDIHTYKQCVQKHFSMPYASEAYHCVVHILVTQHVAQHAHSKLACAAGVIVTVCQLEDVGSCMQQTRERRTWISAEQRTPPTAAADGTAGDRMRTLGATTLHEHMSCVANMRDSLLHAAKGAHSATNTAKVRMPARTILTVSDLCVWSGSDHALTTKQHYWAARPPMYCFSAFGERVQLQSNTHNKFRADTVLYKCYATSDRVGCSVASPQGIGSC
jgi:hypothetical protein